MQSKNESFKLFLKRFQPLTVKESLVKHALYAHVLLNTLYYACLTDWRRRRTVSVGRYSVRLGQIMKEQVKHKNDILFCYLLTYYKLSSHIVIPCIIVDRT